MTQNSVRFTTPRGTEIEVAANLAHAVAIRANGRAVHGDFLRVHDPRHGECLKATGMVVPIPDGAVAAVDALCAAAGVSRVASLMTREELRAVGESLYGRRWQSGFAAALGVAPRTVRRWVAGQTVPPAVAEAIRALGRAGARCDAAAFGTN